MAKVKRLAKKLKLSLQLARPYQNKRTGGAEERWALMSGEIDESDRSVLDVGSNLGMMTELAAAGGRFAIGVEPSPQLIRIARRRTRAATALGFVQMGIDPDNALTLPEMDVVFCLSVHHYWVAMYGEDVAWKIVGDIMSKGRKKVFFEPASVKRKYGGAPLDFEDLNREEIVEYNMKRLESVAAPDQTIRVLGETPCRPKEPFRMMFLIERNPTSQLK